MKFLIYDFYIYEISNYEIPFYEMTLQRLYQYNEDDFLITVLIVNKLFSSYKFTSNQRGEINWQLFLTSMFMCVHAV